jgi:hypothetical protein
MTQDIDKNSTTVPSEKKPDAREGPAAHPMHKEHEGATEDEMMPTSPPTSPEFDDEPKQG